MRIQKRRFTALFLVIAMLMTMNVGLVFAESDIDVETQSEIDKLLESDDLEDHLLAFEQIKGNGGYVYEYSYSEFDVLKNMYGELDLSSYTEAPSEEREHILEYRDRLEESVFELQLETDDYLSALNYSNEQIDAIRNYDGSDELLEIVSASVTVNGAFYNFTNSPTGSRCQMDTIFKWTGYPTGATDIFAVTWAEGWMRGDSSNILRYIDKNSSPYAYEAEIIEGNYNVNSITIPVQLPEAANLRLVIGSGMMTTNLYAAGNNPEVYAFTSYGTSTVTATPSVSVGPGSMGLGLTFSSGVKELDSKTLQSPLDIPSKKPEVVTLIEPGITHITGYGNSGSRIIVTIGNNINNTFETYVNAQGVWTVDISALIAKQKVEIVQIDPGYMPSEPIIIEVPTMNYTFPPNINPIYENSTMATGFGRPGATVYATFPGGIGNSTTVSSTNEWYLPIPVSLSEGQVVVFYQSEVGKLDSKPVRTIVQRAVETSSAPTVNAIYPSSTRATGKGIPGSTIHAHYPNGAYITNSVDGSGNWYIPIAAKVSPNEAFTFTQQEVGKIQSDSVKIYVSPEPVIESAAPEVFDIYTTSNMAMGSGVPGATVYCILPNGAEVKSVVAGTGVWIIPIPTRLTGGDVLHFYQIEEGKLPSQWISKVVKRPS